MDSYEDRIGKTAAALDAADYILVGGGAGLSAAAELEYARPRFRANFADFMAKYGVQDMYAASFYPFKTDEELWAHWARHIQVNRFAPPATARYKEVLGLVEQRPYFVVSTNVDSQFEKSGFPKDRIFEVQGNYAYLQCARGCHEKLYYDEPLVQRMLAATEDCRIPAELVPVCPVCAGPMDVNLRHNDFFVEDSSWRDARSRYESFLEEIEEASVVCLELGVGFNTPGIIRYLFERLVYRNGKVTLVRLNRDDPEGPPENADRTIAFDEDMGKVVQSLLRGGDDARDR